MQEMRRARRRRSLLLFGTVVASVVAALGIVSRLESLAIQGISVQNETSIPTGKIEALVRGELRGSYALVVARQTALLYPKRAIREALVEAFPEIGSVSFDIKAGRVLALLATSRERHALWCGESENKSERESLSGCYFIDRDGLLFAPAEGERASSTYFRYYGALALAPRGTSTPIGAKFLASTEFAWLEKLRTLLSRDLSLESVSLSVVGQDALVSLSSGTELYFSRSEPFSAAIENLATLIASRAGTLSPEHAGALDGLQYVDVRFGNRLYYR